MGDQLQTTERPSCVLDYISTDDSVITFAETYDRRISRLMLELLSYSRIPFFEGPRFSPPHDLRSLLHQ